MSERFTIETEREEDGRWIAEIPELPGVMAYGSTPEDAAAKATALALRVIADRIEHGETIARALDVSFVAA
jgi:predicted RNase H-like HicB family nuclease